MFLNYSWISGAKILNVLFIMILIIGLMGCNSQEKTTGTAKDMASATTNDKMNTEVSNAIKDETQLVEGAKHDSPDFKVTLLGTGHPHPSSARMGASTLVEVGEEKLLFDAGRGAALRLYEYGVLPGEIDTLFLTHLHSDHVVGIDDVLLTGWLPYLGERKTPFFVWGPVGTETMMYHLSEVFESDIHARVNYTDAKGVEVITQDINEGVIFEQNGVKVTSFLVEHEPDPSYGYRIDYKGRSVVISGDTAYSKNLVEHAKDVDVLVHEVAFAKPEDLQSSKTLQQIMSIHVSPEEAGKIFSETQPKLAVYSHIVLLGGIREESVDLIELTKKTYSGDVVVGEDLMTFEISDEIIVKKPGILEEPDAITNE